MRGMRGMRWAVLAVVVTVASACGVGTGTLRIADAQAEIVLTVAAVVDVVGLDTSGPVVASPLEQCTLRSGGPGLRTRVSVRAPLLDATTPLATAFDRSASVLIERGLVLVESGVPGTLLGQRDGVTVTVGGDVQAFEIDALTGCRPR
jgi:hypothetical protein